MSLSQKAADATEKVYQGMKSMTDAPWYPFLDSLWTPRLRSTVERTILEALQEKESKKRAAQAKKEKPESPESKDLWGTVIAALREAGDLTEGRDTYFFPMVGRFVDRSVGAWIVEKPEGLESNKKGKTLLGVEVLHDEMMDEDGDESPTRAYVKSLSKELEQHLPSGYWVEPIDAGAFAVFSGEATSHKTRDVEEKRTIFDIPAPNMKKLCAKLEKLNKKAKKLGFPPATLEVIKQYKVESKEYPFVPMQYYQVKVIGEGPIISGWRWIGVIDHVSFSGVSIVHKIGQDGEDIPSKYYDAPPDCDHCNLKRTRNKTYLLKNLSTGEIKQVGKSCLRDFLGHKDAESIASSLLLWDELEIDKYETWEESEGSGGGYMGIPIHELLFLGIVIIERDGKYISKNNHEFDDIPTAYKLESVIPKAYKIPESKRNDGVFWPTLKQKERAVEALAWILTLDPEKYAKENGESFNFIKNLKQIALSKIVEPSGFAYALQILVMHEKDKRKQREEEKRNNLFFLGEVGEKISLNVTLQRKIPYDNQWGGGTIYVFESEDGNQIIWKPSSAYPKTYQFRNGKWSELAGLEKGDKVLMSAEIKDLQDHHTYGKQTVVKKASFSMLYPEGTTEQGERVIEAIRFEQLHDLPSVKMENFILLFSMFLHQWKDEKLSLYSKEKYRNVDSSLWDFYKDQLSSLWDYYHKKPRSHVAKSLNKSTADLFREIGAIAYDYKPKETLSFLSGITSRLQEDRPRGVKSLFDLMSPPKKAPKKPKKKKKKASIFDMDDAELAEHFNIQKSEFDHEADFDARIASAVLRLPLAQLQSWILTIAQSLDHRKMREKHGENTVDTWMEKLEDIWEEMRPKRKPKKVYQEINKAVYLWLREAMPSIDDHGLSASGQHWGSFYRDQINSDYTNTEKIKGDFWEALEDW